MAEGVSEEKVAAKKPPEKPNIVTSGKRKRALRDLGQMLKLVRHTMSALHLSMLTEVCDLGHNLRDKPPAERFRKPRP